MTDISMVRTTIKKDAVVLFVVLALSFPLSGVCSARPAKPYTGIFGLWAWGNWDDALNIVKKNGFDIAVGVSSKSALDRAHALGIKCIVDCGMTQEIVQDDGKWRAYLDGLRKKVWELKDHPAVFAWYIVDEPDWRGIPPERIKEARDMVRSIDAVRPLFTVLCIPEKWSAYMPYFDIVSVDPYLKKRPGDTPEKVREWIKKIRRDLQNAGSNKPVWVVLGAFEERPKMPLLWESPFKKPTPDEFKEMVSIALSEKIGGILVWTLSFKDFPRYHDWRLPDDDPQLWDAVRNLPHAVRSLAQ